MKTLLGLAIIAAFLFLIYLLLRRIYRGIRGAMAGTAKSWERAEVEANQRRLAQLGDTREKRAAAIKRMFEANNANLSAAFAYRWQRQEEPAEVVRREKERERHMTKEVRENLKPLAPKTVTAKVFFNVSRNLAGFDNRERTYMRAAEELNSAADGLDRRFRSWRAALIWADGKGTWSDTTWDGLRESERENPVAAVMQQARNLTLQQVMSDMQMYASQGGLAPEYREILADFVEKVTPETGGGRWLTTREVGGSAFAPTGKSQLRLGSLSDGTPLTYSDEGSLVTIAPPGSGKTQCNVFPNLLSWPGPAVVLDITGDLFEKTAGWRSTIGPIYKFAPLEPENSSRYNPLAFVRQEPDFIWEDSRLLAEMMIVPNPASKDPFWENEARTALTAAIAYVCHGNSPENRPMHAVLDILFGGKAWNEMIVGLNMAVDVRVMMQHGTALSEMNEKTRSSVLQTARASLGAWTGERVARATAAADWHPEELRSATNPTIYIYVKPNEVDAYLSLLRVFIGQHIRTLTGGDVPDRDSPQILVMLDELPRLRYMAPVEEALNIGRQYKLNLWMFAQSVGQFQTAYENADGLLGACAVRVFMNPGGADGLAEKLSEELGNVDSLNDNSRRRMVEASDLAGPDYRDVQLVLSRGSKPAKVSKDFAFADPELLRRMEMPAPTNFANRVGA